MRLAKVVLTSSPLWFIKTSYIILVAGGTVSNTCSIGDMGSDPIKDEANALRQRDTETDE